MCLGQLTEIKYIAPSVNIIITLTVKFTVYIDLNWFINNILFYFNILEHFIHVMSKLKFQHHYSSLRHHMILQKSFQNADLPLKKHIFLLLSRLKTIVLLNNFAKTLFKTELFWNNTNEGILVISLSHPSLHPSTAKPRRELRIQFTHTRALLAGAILC